MSRNRIARFVCLALAAILLTSGVYSQPGQIAAAASPRPELVSNIAQTSPYNPDRANTLLSSSQQMTTTYSARNTIYLPVASNPPSGFFVAPDGSSRGNGSSSKPWDLKTAFAHPNAVKPGATLWLRGGTYSGGQSKLKGTAERPIIVRNFPGERAVIDGTIMAYGEYTWFWGFEITNSVQRQLTDDDHNRRGPGIGMYGRGQKAINLTIHNAGHPAIMFGEDAQDGEIYGCVIWGTGLYQNDLIRGSGIYAQNLSGRRLISDVISFRNFTTGMKTWSQQAHGIGMIFEGVIAFDNGDRNIFAGSSTYPLEDLTLIDSYTYRRPDDPRIGVQLGYESNLNNQNLLVAGNTFVNGKRSSDLGALGVSFWASGEITNNTIVSRKTVAAFGEPDAGQGKPVWRNNQFFGPENSFWYDYQNGSYELLDFMGWSKKLGFNDSNTYTAGLPHGTHVYVRPNKYESGRGHIAVYNWDKKPQVAVELSGVLKHGQLFVIYDAQNLLGEPVVQGVYDGKPVNIPLDLTKVSPITGVVTHIENVHTPVEFGAYVVIGK
jgi:hypothetical protein